MKTKLLFLCIIFSAYASTAESKPITMRFSGTVTSTDANTVNISEVQVGDKVTGNFTFDTEAIDEMPSDPYSGLYLSEILNVKIDGYQYSATGNNISMTNDAMVIPNTQLVDAFELVSPLRDVIGPDLSGLPIAQIDIVVVDTTAVVFSDDALPTSMQLSLFE